jgi:hypothetical protein
MASISAAAPQFLVDRPDDALAFYEQRLGFERDAAAASSPRGSRVSGSSRGSSPLGSDCGFGLEHFRLFSGCWRWPMAGSGREWRSQDSDSIGLSGVGLRRAAHANQPCVQTCDLTANAADKRGRDEAPGLTTLPVGLWTQRL